MRKIVCVNYLNISQHNFSIGSSWTFLRSMINISVLWKITKKCENVAIGWKKQYTPIPLHSSTSNLIWFSSFLCVCLLFVIVNNIQFFGWWWRLLHWKCFLYARTKKARDWKRSLYFLEKIYWGTVGNLGRPLLSIIILLLVLSRVYLNNWLSAYLCVVCERVHNMPNAKRERKMLTTKTAPNWN